jgi:hypothetical protein
VLAATSSCALCRRLSFCSCAAHRQQVTYKQQQGTADTVEHIQLRTLRPFHNPVCLLAATSSCTLRRRLSSCLCVALRQQSTSAAAGSCTHRRPAVEHVQLKSTLETLRPFCNSHPAACFRYPSRLLCRRLSSYLCAAPREQSTLPAVGSCTHCCLLFKHV